MTKIDLAAMRAAADGSVTCRPLRPVDEPAVRAARGTARARLLDAAVQVIRTKGLSATSVDDLCAAAGVTKGAFFHHFESKQALAVAAAEHWSQTTGALFAAADYHAIADPLDRILGYLDLRARLIAGSPADYTCLVGTMTQEAFATYPDVRDACAASIFGHARTLEARLRSKRSRRPAIRRASTPPGSPATRRRCCRARSCSARPPTTRRSSPTASPTSAATSSSCSGAERHEMTRGERLMTTLDKQFTATLQKSPAKGGWTYVVMPGLGRVLRHARAGQGDRHGRRPPVPELVHGARRRHPQAADQGRPAPGDQQGGRRRR